MYLFTLMTQSQSLSPNFHRKLFDLYVDFLRFSAEKVEYRYFIVSKMFAFFRDQVKHYILFIWWSIWSLCSQSHSTHLVATDDKQVTHCSVQTGGGSSHKQELASWIWDSVSAIFLGCWCYRVNAFSKWDFFFSFPHWCLLTCPVCQVEL